MTNTDSILNDLKELERALRNIRVTRKNIRIYAKAFKAGKIDTAAYTSAIGHAKERLAFFLTIANERGFAIGQGDEGDWETRAAATASIIATRDIK